MIRKISLFSLLLLVFSFTFAPTVSAGLFDNSKQEACEGVALSSNPSTTCDGTRTINRLMSRVISIFSIVVGVISVIMIIISGIKYITSQGDSNAVASAKNSLIYAIVGLIIVAMSQLIVRFVLTKATLPNCPAGQTQINVAGDCIVQ